MAKPHPQTDSANPAESPVLSGLSWPPSAVARPDNPWALGLGIAAAAFLGVIVFSALSQDRQARAQNQPNASPQGPAASKPSAAALPGGYAVMPPLTSSPASSQPQVQQQTMAQLTPTQAANLDPSGRLHSPAMVVDIAGDSGAQVAAPSGGVVSGSQLAPQTDARLSGMESFADRVAAANVDTSRATRLHDTALIAPQGTVIAAVMETAINLDLPGFVRAVVSRDVRGFDGSTVLIPRGSHLVGQYRSGTVAGQSRAFIVWSRVLTPDGVSVDIGSPASDRLGRGGLEGDTNTHFFRRFGNAILLSVISAGIESATSNGDNNRNTAIVIGSQQQATNIASIALQKEIDIPNTITVMQGTPIRVFVARDLDFTNIITKKP
jgi:type IV secretory pathway VirB10-like protein